MEWTYKPSQSRKETSLDGKIGSEQGHPSGKQKRRE